MPNYSLVAGVTYDPLTYQEIAVPVKEAADYHQALQDKYDELNMTTQMYDRLIDEDDEVARPMFNAFMNNLNTAADALTKGGGWGQRDVFSNLRGSYSRNMMPIQIGFNTRKAEATEQAKHPELKYSRDAGTTKLGWYVQNPNGGFKVANPATMTAQVATMAKAYLNQLRQNPNGEAAIQLKAMGVDDSMLETIIQYGLPADAIANWRNIPALKAIMSTVLKANGMNMDDNGFGVANETWDANTTNELIEAMSTGLAAGAGQDKVSIQQNPVYAAEMAAARAAAGKKSSDSDSVIDYGRPNDHSFTIDDSLTDKGEMDKLINSAAMNGLIYDKDKNEFRYDPNAPASSVIGRGIDAFQGRVSEMIPFRRSNGEIMQEIAQENGWKFIDINGFQVIQDKNGKTVRESELAKAYTNKIRNVIGSYHTVQDISLTDYNSAFKSQKIYSIDKINKNGSYGTDTDNPTTIASILNDKDADAVQAGVSMTPTNKGLMLVVTKGGKKKYYFIKMEDISDPNLRANLERLSSMATARDNEMRRRGLSSSEYYSLLPSDQSLQGLEYDYNTALLGVQGSIGSSNSVSNINLFGK